MKGSIVLFDGVCNLCSGTVQFILKRDRAKKFVFASLQGEKGQALLQQYGLSVNEFHSFVFIEDGKAYTRSTGALRVFRKLGGVWKLLYGFIIVPRFIRDAVYNTIARNRYKWYGKKEECWVPTAELRERFLD